MAYVNLHMVTNHSTETALIRVYNDIALSIDSRKSVVWVLLDLSAAFDTVDHFFRLSRLSARFGICDHVLNRLRSYLSHCTQFIRIQDVSSHVNDLLYGVPGGSVLGPLLNSLYTSPLGEIARSFGLSYQFMRIIPSYICPLKRHLLRICQFVNLLLKIALGKLTCGC